MKIHLPAPAAIGIILICTFIYVKFGIIYFCSNYILILFYFLKQKKINSNIINFIEIKMNYYKIFKIKRFI